MRRIRQNLLRVISFSFILLSFIAYVEKAHRTWRYFYRSSRIFSAAFYHNLALQVIFPKSCLAVFLLTCAHAPELPRSPGQHLRAFTIIHVTLCETMPISLYAIAVPGMHSPLVMIFCQISIWSTRYSWEVNRPQLPCRRAPEEVTLWEKIPWKGSTWN